MGAFSSERPTLPPLHSLGLPNPSAGTTNALHELSYDNPSCPHLHIPQWRHARQVSSSSSTTSRSTSPTLFDSSSSRASSPSTDPESSAPSTPVLSISPLSSRVPSTASPNMPPLRFRLEPCTLDEAQAIVLIPPPSAPFVPSTSTPAPQKKQQALLLLGPSMQYRNPQRQLAKGARIHPYRIAPSQRKDAVCSRRSSGSSTSAPPA
ncbi:hypothetical protein D9615_005971 [Tricholomella constricta]|uniref:Uncharacterized protein n=1 Tax=Tricholomella constricta TaxID=117010 RepID=A0A8H5H978_9AGAR|nr:hypothetical protein D9615_005971 [Tricholomella constricta]